MADRWLYIHAGAAHGPVDLEKLGQLAVLGKVLPTDQVWPAGEDLGSAVEAHTLLHPEVFRGVQRAVEEALANPSQSASATPDWLTDVAMLSEPAPADKTPDVEVVDEEEPAPVPPPVVPLAEPIKPSKRASLPGRPAAPATAPVEADGSDDDEHDTEDSGLGFRRRDLIAFGLGVVGVSAAMAIGLFFAKPWRGTTDEVPAKEDGGKGRP